MNKAKALLFTNKGTPYVFWDSVRKGILISHGVSESAFFFDKKTDKPYVTDITFTYTPTDEEIILRDKTRNRIIASFVPGAGFIFKRDKEIWMVNINVSSFITADCYIDPA